VIYSAIVCIVVGKHPAIGVKDIFASSGLFGVLVLTEIDAFYQV
jgi:hypothetical protein